MLRTISGVAILAFALALPPGEAQGQFPLRIVPGPTISISTKETRSEEQTGS